MSGRGKAFAVVSILTLMIGIGMGVLPAQAQDKTVDPASNQIINYPSFPLRGGPYILGTTYEPGNATIVIVFNEDVDDSESDTDLTAGNLFESNSFDITGGTWDTGDAADDNVWWITGVDAADQFVDTGLERIRLVKAAAVTGIDGSISDDMSWHTIGRGPIPEDIVLTNFEDDADFNNQTIVITWNEAADLVGGIDLAEAFGGTPEFNGVLAANLNLVGATTDTWTVTHTGGGTVDFLKMFGGITKLHIASGAVRYDGGGHGSVANNRELKWTLMNRAPYPVASYYVDSGTVGDFTDDAIWVVFNEPVTEASAVGALGAEGDGTMFEIIQVDAAGSSANGGNVTIAFPGSVTQLVKITGITDAGGTTEPDATDLLRYIDGAQDIADFLGQTLDSPDLGADVDVTLHLGPGIIKAAYDDGQTPSDPSNDRLMIWFSEPLAGAVDVDTTDFRCNDEWNWGDNPQILVEANVNGLGRVTITNFTGATTLPGPGMWIRAHDDGTAITDADAQDVDVATRIFITDESRPSTVNLASAAQSDLWDTDYEGTGAAIDQLRFAWVESGGGPDDSDQYFMFITKTLPVDIDNDWMDQNLDRAIPLGNKRPGINGDSTRVELLVKPDETDPAVPGEITQTTDQVDIEENDQVYLVVAAADWTGNTQYRTQGQGTVALLFSAPIWVGGMCPPVDFDVNDDDLIHVIGTVSDADSLYQVFGDPGAVPCVADSIKAYYDPTPGDHASGDEVFLGHGPVNGNGSFPPFDLLVERLTGANTDLIYLAAKLGIDETLPADWLPIYYDRYYPIVSADQIFDPWNPYQIYNANDYVNIRLLLDDRNADYGGGTVGRNDCAYVVANFSYIDSVATNPTGFSATPDEIVMIGLGRDRIDNDGDWDEATDDVGYVVNGVLTGAGNGLPDFGDPYIDENGNGQWDPGETFLDLVTGGNSTNRWDAGEPNLDSNDPDEQGWYEVRSTLAGSLNTIKQGYPLTEARVRKLAYTDPFSLVEITIKDNGLDATGGLGSPDDRSMDHVRVLDGTDPTQRFLASIDFQEPTVSEVTELFSEQGAATDAATNLIEPGNPVYDLGRYLDITVEAPSDDDVILAQLQLKKGDVWQPLSRDPIGDGNGDAFPGDAGFSDDFDEAGETVNADGDTIGIAGVDDDQNGIIDDPGEGIDLRDREVKNASETAAQAAANPNDDGVNCENDLRDNDNDAYFVFDTFAPGDPNDPTAGYGVMTWWNIDESPTNGLDDDGDGNVDEADEYPECSASNTNRYLASNDDNEDGIADGEAVAINVGAGTNFLFGPDPTFNGTIYVAKAKVLGYRTSANATANNLLQNFYVNGVPYTDVVAADYSVMTASVRRFPTNGYDTEVTPAQMTDAATLNTFNWYDTHGSENIDLLKVSRMYGLTADGATEYQLRGVLWDVAGNSNEAWAEPITFTMDLTAPVANLDGCGTDELNDGSDFADVNASTADIVEIYDAGKHPGTYTLVMQDVDADAVEVKFQERRRNLDGTWPTTWEEIGTDTNAPFTMEWPATGEMFTVNNYPADRYQDVQFRALAKDAQNNWTQDEDECIFDVRVIDGTIPASWIRGVYLNSAGYYETDDYTALGNIVQVPPDPSVNIWIRIEDNDRDAKGRLTTLLPGKSAASTVGDPYTTMWAAGLDRMPGDAMVDDDASGVVDEDDAGLLNGATDGVYTLGAGPDLGDDVAVGWGCGPDSIPGTADDEWNGSTANGGGDNTGLTDDYITNDVKYVVVQYRQVNPPGEWTDFATVHGDDGANAGQVYDYTQPVKVTLDTQYLADNLGEGLYELRAYACDVEGNCNVDEAPIAVISLRANPLRAYIQPEICTGATMFDLYAVHYIHDYEINKVRFEYYYDADGNLCADDGNAWTLIDIDDEFTAGDPRGDAVLYMPPDDVVGADPLEELIYFASLAPADVNDVAVGEYWFYDPEEDGYSPRDPVVEIGHVGGTIYSAADDVWVLGDASALADGVTLTPFAADEFYAQVAGEATGLDPTDWIFRENELTGINAELDLWMVSWDATGLPEGNYLARAIAIDAQNNMDEIDYTCYDPTMQNPEEIELVRLDTTLPTANITTLTVDTGEVLDVSALAVPPYVPGNAKWVMIEADGSDDVARMLFEFSTNGGVTWTAIDVNDDQDWYADIDGTAGFSAEDEIIIDLNGDFVFNAADDFVRYAGANGVVDTPEGWPLMPLVSEEVADGTDTDGDGLVDEDTSLDPRDYDAPYVVFLTMADLPLNFMTDVTVMLRVTPSDMVCEDYRAGTPDVVSVIFGENQPPEADVVRVEDLNGIELDVRPVIHDGDGVVTIGPDVDSIRVFVTAEDMSTIDKVELWYRLDPTCHEPDGVADLQWQMMPAEWTVADDSYPYDFDVATDPIPDGAYQFYPRAYDQSGNFNTAPENPWGFKKFSLTDIDFAYVSVPAGPPALPDTAAVGDEYVIHAMLLDMDLAPTTSVLFMFAPRILDEMVDPATVQPLPPYTAPALDETVLGAVAGDGVLLTIDGVEGTFHPDLSLVGAPTKLDYTLAGNSVVFGARPDADDVILVSYNFYSWMPIHEGDTWSPYTVAWSQENGGVPAPAGDFAAADAYDLIATAQFDLNGNGVYDGPNSCDYAESPASEGNYLYLRDMQRPLVLLYGLNFEDVDAPGYLDWNWPGNPLFASGDDLQDWNFEAKLSGIETDIFVVATDQGGGAITDVDLTITAEDIAGGVQVVREYQLAEYSIGTYIDIPITFYEDDYPQWLPHAMDPGGTDDQLQVIENVILQVSVNAGSNWSRVYEMTYDEDTHSWSAVGRFDIGITNSATQRYRFVVDLRGDEQAAVYDARNNNGVYSALNVPTLPFWYVHIDNLDATDGLVNNAVHRAVVTATDDSGNTGNNLNSGVPGNPDTPQGPIVFIHDRTAPVVQNIFITNLDNQPLPTNRISPNPDYRIWATINDEPFTDINILAIDYARFQYSPDNGRTWIDIDTDGDPIAGWSVDFEPEDPLTDGYDNDGDGYWDEEDESVADYLIRVIPVDDGMNHGYSDRQDPIVQLTVTVDAAQPDATILQPLDGQIVDLNGTVDIEASVVGDWLSPQQGDDIERVYFQVKFTRFYYVKDDPADPRDWFVNGVDEIWLDADGDGIWSAGDNVLFGYEGADGVARTADDNSPANFWFDIDPTPQDNGDNPWLTAPNSGDNYLVTWAPAGYDFIRANNFGVDEYARIRVKVKDTAGNWNTDAGLPEPPEVLVILNDNTVTRAYITHLVAQDDAHLVSPAETFPVMAMDPIPVFGRLFMAGTGEAQLVKVYRMNGDGSGTAEVVGIDQSNVTIGTWDVVWNASALADGSEHILYATVVDTDGNESSEDEATKIRVRIDRTAPVVNYEPIAPGYAGFASGVQYRDDGIVDHSSWVIVPDMYTGDVEFAVTTTDTDVETMTLQWRWAIDPVGLWRDLSELLPSQASDELDYEPNLSFNGNHFFWLHVEDFADALDKSGRMEFRVLAQDQAGNTNALQLEVAEWTADNTLPVGFDWNDDIPLNPNQLGVGETVNFEISMQDGEMDDLTRTDIVESVLLARPVGGNWMVVGEVVPLGYQIDSGNGMWVAQFAWTAPEFVAHDTTFEFKVQMLDAAGNAGEYVWVNTIIVEDNAPPDRTKIVDVAGGVYVAEDPDGGMDNPDVWVELSVPANTTYEAGVDFLISEGEDLTPPTAAATVVIGDLSNIYPRVLTEGFLNDPADRNTFKVSNSVVLVGRTQAHDDGIGQEDNGIQWVTFVLQPVDAGGNPVGDHIVVGRDEYAPGFPLYYWHLTLDTTLYPDGRYKVGAYARDEQGNVEDTSTLDWTHAVMVIDNADPEARMVATAPVVTNDSYGNWSPGYIPVERNSVFTLLAETLIPGTDDPQNYEDNVVDFYYKRSRDLNDVESWDAVPEAAGAGPEDGLPDITRPYSFDLNMAYLALPGGDGTPDPTDPTNWVPLAVGETYDFVMDVRDEVGNNFTFLEAFADSATIGPRYVKVKIVDTIAPHLEFTEALRAGLTGDLTPQENPTQLHAQAFEYIEAKLPQAELDMAYAEFVYRKLGDTTWNLIDAPQSEFDSYVWRVGPWDLQTLEHNEWYEVACIGVDDIGNVDPNPDILLVYVDYQAPPFTLVAPSANTSTWCNGVMDLVIEVDRGANQQHDDVWDVVWQWKLSTDPDITDSWFTTGVASATELYDDTTNRYSNTLNLDVETVPDVLDLPTNLYDLRVMVIDEAGNSATYDVLKNTVDQDAPDYAQISNIKLIGDDTTLDPNDQGQTVDVTAGTMVEIFGTASDDEAALPNMPDPQTGRFYETVIAAMQFEVARDLNGNGAIDAPEIAARHDIGVVQLDPPDLGDMSAQTASILWNTTGLAEGAYFLRVLATDECGLTTASGWVDVNVIDWTPPIARIVAWDADLQPHGEPDPSWITIYAMAECDDTDADPDTPGWQPVYDVQFQYNLKESGETSPTGEWINIGIAEPVPAAFLEPGPDAFTTETLWYTTIQPVNLPPMVGDQMWLRALVKDENGNRFGDLPDDIVPTVLVEVIEYTNDLGVADGTLSLKQIRSAEMVNGAEMVEEVSVMVESPTNLILTVKMATQDHAPRAVLVNELAEPRTYPSPDHVWNYSPGVQYGGAPLGLVRSLDDPTVWRCNISLENGLDCTHYAFWVTALDGTEGTAMWIDMVDTYFREFPVTTPLGTNGTVAIPAYETLGMSIMVPSGGWVDNKACLLVSPTMPPLISTDQARYINPVDMTAYHMEMLSGTQAFRRGYEPLVVFQYSDEMAAAALTGTESTEDDLTVRRWDTNHANRDGTTGAWVGTGISHIKVYPDENEVAFRLRDLTGAGGGGGGGGTDLVFVIDGSGSMESAEFTLQINGIAAALVDPSIIPADGTVSVAVVQFDNTGVIEVPLTAVTSAAVAAGLAADVQAIVQGGGGTNISAGLDTGVTALGGGTAGFVQTFVLCTDAGSVGAGDIASADAAVAAGVESIYVLGLDASDVDMDAVGQLVRGSGTAVLVDTLNDFEAAVAGMVTEIVGGSSSGGGNVFQLFAPKQNAPVVLSSIWPNSPYVNDWWTDADPAIVVYLRDPGGQGIDPNEVELLIDDEFWATWLNGAGDAQWIRGNGTATLAYVNQDQTIMELVYHHSTYPRDWLANGSHTLTVRHRASNGTDDWMEDTILFFVDRVAPYIKFDGGFVSNPNLGNAHGYMNPAKGGLMAEFYDAGAGVLFKHDRPWYYQDLNCDGILSPDELQFDPEPYGDGGGCWIRVDLGMKYDLWLVEPKCGEDCWEDDQRDIDEIEERVLLHQGTANELEPWIMVRGERITLDQYNPATDTLQVPVPVLGGGDIKDNSILEIVWYSDKSIEANSDGPGWGCVIDTVVVNGVEFLMYSHGCTYDAHSQEMHIYNEGVVDWASNTGSKYVEQRFIVDMTGPKVHLISPVAKVDPNGDMKIEVAFEDAGCGVAGATVDLTDPEGKLVVFDPPLVLSGGKISGEVAGPLMRGEWTIKVVATDCLGNTTTVVETIMVESAVLTLVQPKVFPNPFNPGEEEATIGVDISKTSQVSMKIYDWAGEYVTTLVNNEVWAPGHGPVKWAGEASDHTDLANGAYMCRITATDTQTGKTEESTLKIVIWRE